MTKACFNSCHCYSRNCPQGMPNQKTGSAIGSSCVMNSLGRHFRDQTDTEYPACDYENSGVKCDFFTTVNDHNQLAYPTDITFGPVVAEPAATSADLSAILSMLEAQKLEADIRSQKQDEQKATLQTQIHQLSLGACWPCSRYFCSKPACTTCPSLYPVNLSTSSDSKCYCQDDRSAPVRPEPQPQHGL